MHRLLQRQIARAKKRTGELDFEMLLELVNAAYVEADRERERGDRATLMTCEEMDKLNEELRQLAHHDTLTGLPNRLLFAEVARRGIRRAQLGKSLALLLIDLDKFKCVNDTLGHAMGDALLCEVAARLRTHARDGDVVARIGGDEFAIVQIGSDQPESAQMLASRLVKILGATYAIRGHRIEIGASVGIAVATATEQSIDLLLKNADAALYHAKNAGRNTWRLFRSHVQENESPVFS